MKEENSAPPAPIVNFQHLSDTERKTVPYDLTYIPLGSGGWGGAERSLLDLAGRMASRGKRVLILAERALEASPFYDEAKKRNLDIVWVDWAPQQSLLVNLCAAIRTFRSLDTKIIHFNISWRRGMHVIPLLARIFTRSRLIGSMRAMPDPLTFPRKRHFGGLVPSLQLWTIPDLIRGHIWARAMHLTVSVNRYDYPKRLVSDYGYCPKRIRVIYNGVDVPDILPSDEERRLQRHQFGCMRGDFLVCYFGRISSEKGIHHLLQALSVLPAHVRLLIIGEGPNESQLMELSRTLGISDRVRFVGFLSKPEAVVSTCDLVVVPSTWYEAFGRTVVEALVHQVPVVASRVGGMAELFIDGEHGLYVPPADSAALREAIGRLANDLTLAREMGVKGRRWVRERYSMERVAQDYAATYTELLAETLPT